MKHFFFACALLLLPACTHAAALTFDAQDSTAGIGTEFVIALNASADIDTPVNAFDVSVRIPESLTPVDTSDGNSIISFWMERPTFNEETRLLSFSGIIPNGYAGVEGRLVTITVIPNSSEQTARVAVDPATQLFTGAAMPVVYSAEPLMLAISTTKQNLSTEVLDRDPPEDFIIELTSDPALYEGRQTLVFSTVDKSSGMAVYTVRSQWLNVWWSPWKIVTSPYAVGTSWFVTAYEVAAHDKAGNRQVSTLTLDTNNYAVLIVVLISAAIAVLLLRYVRRRWY